MENVNEQGRRYKKYTSRFKRLVVVRVLQQNDWNALLNTETRKVLRTTAEGWIRRAQARKFSQKDKRRGGKNNQKR